MTLNRASVLLAAGLFCATAQAQVTTDDCAAATVGITGPGTLQWDNSAATTGTDGQDETLCYSFGSTGIDNDVWTIYTAGSTGCAEVTTCNSGGTITDSKIAAYPAGGCPAVGTSLACDDDDPTCALLSTISFPVTAGQSYLLQLGNFPNASAGTAQIDITELPAGGPALTNQDDCANAGFDNVGPGQYGFSTLAATTGTEGQNEAGCYFFGSTVIDRDIWFTYTATQDGCASIATCNSDQPCATFLDTKIAVYPTTGACPVNGTSLACNEDACNGLRSMVVFPVTAGSSYSVQVGSFPGAAAGNGLIDITEVPCPATLSNQDDCANAAVDTIGIGTYGWDNLGATTGVEGQNEALCYALGFSGIQGDIWAVYVADTNGSVTIDTCSTTGTNDDTKIAAYPLAPCGSIDNTSVACNDDTCALLSEITFPVQCGERYLLQLGSFPSSSDGTADLTISESGAPCGSGPIGSTPTECNPNSANSTGVPATIRAEGQVDASAMDVTVIAESVPPGQFGYFFASETLGFIPNPGGSLGDICVLGNQGRYNASNQIGTGPTLSLDVGSIDIPTNPIGQPILAGETWYWQCWHRDTGTTSNFTNVVCITFN